MRVLDYNLDDSKNGGKISAFNYSRSLNELVGSWSAQSAGGNFVAGSSISFDNVMSNGIISKAYKDSSGLWHIEGKDSGIKLMRSTPEISELPEGNAKTVIAYLANFCGIALNMTPDGLSGFNVRSVISGSTCAEAILELAMLSGCVAFIDNNGALNVAQPVSRDNEPAFDIVIDDSGSDIDLEGYATQVLVNVTRRKEEINSDDDEHIYYTGRTPSQSPTRDTKRGTFSNGSYSITTLEPFDVTEEAECTVNYDNISISTRESHDYDYQSKVIWRENQEYVLFAFIERGYTLTRTITGTYTTESGEELTFSETTTETMSREFSVFDAIGLPEDWDGQLNMISTETITRSTVREGGKVLENNMPDYSPPFDSQIIRTFTRENRGKGLLCNEKEITYEARQVGTISPVKQNGENIPHFMLNSNLAIQTHSTPEWVQVNNYRTYYEQYDNNGECILSTNSEWSDDGAKWLTEHALSDTGDTDINDYQKAYAKFSQHSKGLDISFKSSAISTAWQFVELQGRMKNTSADNEDGVALGNISDWYNNGEYINSRTCPHFNETSKTCNIYRLATASKQECLHYWGGSTWKGCTRARAALNLAREQDAAQIETVIIGSASASNNNTPAAGYQRDLYIDEIITDEQAQSIANTVAQNILNVKSTKGIRKTVTIPYSPSYLPNGLIVEVSHNWENLQTTISYLTSGNIPDFMISETVAGIASFVSTRENSRVNIPKYGAVISVSDSNVQVKIGNRPFSCTTRLKNLGAGDIVLVSFAAGNKLRGQVIARL